MKHLFALLLCLGLPSLAWAGGNTSWEAVHDEIKKDDPVLIAFVDKTLEVAPYGDAMRPLGGPRASERFAPYTFLAKPQGSKGGFVFSLTFDETKVKGHPWTLLVQKK